MILKYIFSPLDIKQKKNNGKEGQPMDGTRSRRAQTEPRHEFDGNFEEGQGVLQEASARRFRARRQLEPDCRFRNEQKQRHGASNAGHPV
jgi:hypothetical protein